MWGSDFESAHVVARTELRAMGRRLTASRRRIAGVAIFLLQFVVAAPVFLYGPATALGRRIVTGTAPLGTLGIGFSVVALTGLYMGGATVVNQNRIGTVGNLVRASISPRAVTLGRLESELVQTSVLFVPPLAVALVEVGIGARSPFVPILLGAGVTALLLAGTFVGRLLGASLRYIGVLSRLGSWAKVVVFVVIMVVFFVGSQIVAQAFLPDDASLLGGVSVPALLPGQPLQAFGGVVLAPYGMTVRPVGVVAVLVTLALIPVALVATTRVETALLLGDNGDSETEVTTRDVPAPLARFRAGRIGWRHLLGTARDPKTIAHTFPIFGGLVPGVIVVVMDAPEFGLSIGPLILVGAGAIMAGATYCLNPLGDDRDQLPLVLTSVRSTDSLLRGRVIAGSVLGLSLSAVGLLIAPFSSEPVATLAVVAFAPVVVPAAAGAALGIGAFSPQFERREYMNVERAHPSQLVLMGYMFGGGALLGGSLFGLWFVLVGALDGTFSPLMVAVGWTVAIVVFVSLGLAGYGYAVSRFDTLTIDDA